MRISILQPRGSLGLRLVREEEALDTFSNEPFSSRIEEEEYVFSGAGDDMFASTTRPETVSRREEEDRKSVV